MRALWPQTCSHRCVLRSRGRRTARKSTWRPAVSYRAEWSASSALQFFRAFWMLPKKWFWPATAARAFSGGCWIFQDFGARVNSGLPHIICVVDSSLKCSFLIIILNPSIRGHSPLENVPRRYFFWVVSSRCARTWGFRSRCRLTDREVGGSGATSASAGERLRYTLPNISMYSRIE